MSRISHTRWELFLSLPLIHGTILPLDQIPDGVEPANKAGLVTAGLQAAYRLALRPEMDGRTGNRRAEGFKVAQIVARSGPLRGWEHRRFGWIG